MKNIGIDLVKKDRLTENVISRFMSKREIDLMNASYTTEEAKQQFAAGR
jgi:phosphopantetheinyl transferase (holo-ACP synthase)